MAKDVMVSQEMAEKFKTEKDTPYLRFVRAEGLDIISAQYVPDLRTVELKPWPRRAGKGVYINHEASRTSNDCYVCEIAPGKKLEPSRHLFEEMILILEGKVEVTIQDHSATLGPGSAAFVASNEQHGWRNVGTGAARYFVLALGRDSA